MTDDNTTAAVAAQNQEAANANPTTGGGETQTAPSGPTAATAASAGNTANISDASDVADKNVGLLGSSKQPASFVLKSGGTMTLGEVVAKAQQDSGLTPEDWNALPDTDRENTITVTIDELGASPAATGKDAGKVDTNPTQPAAGSQQVNTTSNATDSAAKTAGPETPGSLTPPDDTSKEAIAAHGKKILEAQTQKIEPAQHRTTIKSMVAKVINAAERAEHWTVAEIETLWIETRNKAKL